MKDLPSRTFGPTNPLRQRTRSTRLGIVLAVSASMPPPSTMPPCVAQVHSHFPVSGASPTIPASFHSLYKIAWCPVSRDWLPVAVASLLLGFLGGCSPTIRMPRLLHPGTATYQRYQAEQFDPYPQNDMGPEIDGGRPIDYQKPLSQVERARQPMPVGPWRMGSRY